MRLFTLQVVKHDHYKKLAEKNIDSRLEIEAQRGTIYDRKGRVLAKDVLHYMVAVSAKRAANKEKLVDTLSKALSIDSWTIRSKLRRNPNFAYITRRISAAKAESLKRVKDPGLILEKRFLRVYPFRENAAHVLGYVDVDNRPLGGVEYQYNRYLQGKAGWKIFQRDAYGKQLLNPDHAGEDPIDGFDVTLTIDMDFQAILEDELKKAVEENKARDGVAILMNPHSGELLAIANYPQFDPNRANRYSALAKKNRAISDIFEPGSTFKIVPFSAALENLHLNLDKEIVFCENGRFRLFGQTVLDHKKYGWLTLRNVFENSSNIGTMKIAQKLKPALIYRYSRNFGMGMVTGVDLPGESPGILHPLDEFSKITPYYMSIGYEVGVTPLQLINAYAAVANGGDLLIPHIMKSVNRADGREVERNTTQVVRKVISAETTKLLTDLLTGVVENGTGEHARVLGLTVAGKTGTAQIYNPQTGNYDPKRYLASFVGFFPAEHPRFVLLVMIRQPGQLYYGGLVSAPAFRNMTRRIMSLASLETPDVAQLKTVVNILPADYIPRVENLNVNTAVRIIKAQQLEVEIVGNGDRVKHQENILENGVVHGVRLFSAIPEKNQKVTMPLLEGLSLKEAMNILEEYNLVPTVEGHGIVVGQFPRAGTKIEGNNLVKLTCESS